MFLWLMCTPRQTFVGMIVKAGVGAADSFYLSTVLSTAIFASIYSFPVLLVFLKENPFNYEISKKNLTQ